MKKFLLFFTSLFVSSFIFAQSADFVTRMLDTDKATFGQVCYLCAVCQNLVSDNAKEVDAMNAIFEQGILPDEVQPGDLINYKQAAVIFSKVWNIKGGLLFRISNGSPRYAFKQLKNDGVILSNADPSMIPSGVDILNMYTMGEKRYPASPAAQEGK